MPFPGCSSRAALYLSLSALLSVGIGTVYALMYPYVSASLSNTNYILFPWLLHGVCLFPVLTKPDERRLPD